MMHLCSRRHEEVCYEGKYCPVCELLDQVEQFERENSDLRLMIEALEKEIEKVED
jgi:cell division protein FtsB